MGLTVYTRVTRPRDIPPRRASGLPGDAKYESILRRSPMAPLPAYPAGQAVYRISLAGPRDLVLLRSTLETGIGSREYCKQHWRSPEIQRVSFLGLEH